MDVDLRGLDTVHSNYDGEGEEDDGHFYHDDSKTSFSEKLDSQQNCESILIIDGDYFEIGVKELERINPSQQLLSNPQNIERLLSFIESKVGVSSFDWKSFHSAEEPKVKKRKAYYSVLESNGFIFDIREYKSKKVK